MTITVVHALDLASRALLQSEHPDAIEARVVLLELHQILQRYERPCDVPLMKVKRDGRVINRLWCGKQMEPTENPRKAFCCPSHRQRAYEARVPVAANRHLSDDGDHPPSIGE